MAQELTFFDQEGNPLVEEDDKKPVVNGANASQLTFFDQEGNPFMPQLPDSQPEQEQDISAMQYLGGMGELMLQGGTNLLSTAAGAFYEPLMNLQDYLTNQREHGFAPENPLHILTGVPTASWENPRDRAAEVAAGVEAYTYEPRGPGAEGITDWIGGLLAPEDMTQEERDKPWQETTDLTAIPKMLQAYEDTVYGYTDYTDEETPKIIPGWGDVILEKTGSPGLATLYDTVTMGGPEAIAVGTGGKQVQSTISQAIKAAERRAARTTPTIEKVEYKAEKVERNNAREEAGFHTTEQLDMFGKTAKSNWRQAELSLKPEGVKAIFLPALKRQWDAEDVGASTSLVEGQTRGFSKNGANFNDVKKYIDELTNAENSIPLYRLEQMREAAGNWNNTNGQAFKQLIDKFYKDLKAHPDAFSDATDPRYYSQLADDLVEGRRALHRASLLDKIDSAVIEAQRAVNKAKTPFNVFPVEIRNRFSKIRADAEESGLWDSLPDELKNTIDRAASGGVSGQGPKAINKLLRVISALDPVATSSSIGLAQAAIIPLAGGLAGGAPGALLSTIPLMLGRIAGSQIDRRAPRFAEAANRAVGVPRIGEDSINMNFPNPLAGPYNPPFKPTGLLEQLPFEPAGLLPKPRFNIPGVNRPIFDMPEGSSIYPPGLLP